MRDEIKTPMQAFFDMVRFSGQDVTISRTLALELADIVDSEAERYKNEERNADHFPSIATEMHHHYRMMADFLRNQAK